MTPEQRQRAEELARQVHALPPAQRAAFLACVRDTALRGVAERKLAELDQLATHTAASAGVLDLAPEESSAVRNEPPAPSLPADAFPGYEVVRKLSQGGQGVVYQALQKGTNRKVAIKILREGPHAAESARKRFEREIELVAALKHPHIISIFHSGVTAGGQQFYVMDYVRGAPLTQYVREKQLPLEEALKLFGVVCEAVQYAHQKGVIHRDLKPSNILVDSEGVPHILDFGLAKLLAGPVETIVSVSAEVVGTLPYMSPEQAKGNPDEIDTRTDIYALGVILYEMLTGQYPYPVAGQMAEVLRHIAETAPLPPGRAWQAASGISKRSGGRAAKRVRAGACPIDHEMETIALKALAKERQRRYQSAGELARDLGHYLADEPIEARRDSALYVLKKTLRRYKGPVAVAAAFVLLLGGSTVALSLLYQNQSRERQRAEHEAAKALAAEQVAAREKQHAEARAEVVRRRNYVNSIILAQNAYETSNLPHMRELLAHGDADLRGWEWRRLDWLSDRAERVFRGHKDSVQTVAFSPDGRRIVSGSKDGTLKLWDAATGQELRTLTGHVDEVWAVAFSPDGRRIVSGSDDKTLKLWDAATGQELRTLTGADRAFAAAFSPDGRRIISIGGDDYMLKLWDAETGQELHTFKDRVAAATFRSDGRQIVSINIYNTLKFWDAESGQELDARQLWDANRVSAVAFSPNGRQIVLGIGDNTLRLRDVETGQELRMFKGHAERVSAVAFSPDGQWIISAGRASSRIQDGWQLLSDSDSDTLKLWDIENGQEFSAVTLTNHAQAVRKVAFSPDGRRIVAGGWSKTFELWDIVSGPELRVLKGHTGNVFAVALSPDGRRIVSGSGDKTLKLWDAETGQELRTFTGHERPVTAVAFRPDGRRIVSGSDDTTLKLWDTETGQELYTFKGHAQYIAAASFSPDGRQIVSGSHDNTLKLWDTETGQELRTLTGHTEYVTAAAFGPDGRRIMSASNDGTLKLWDAATSRELRTFVGHTDAVSAASFSPDGRRIVSGSQDNTLKLWDAETGQELRTFKGHARGVKILAFSPDGRRIVSGSWDRTLKLWDVESGDELLTLRCGQNVQAVAFSENRIVAGCEKDYLVIWDTADPPPNILETRRAVMEAQRIFELAYRRVDSLFRELLLKVEVQDRLRNDSTLAPAVRAEALRLASLLEDKDNANLLNNASWKVVHAPDKDTDTYRRALRWAEAAAQARPDNGYYLNTLGVAQYRVGQYEQALATLTRSNQINSKSNAEQPADIAFLAMTLYRLGRGEEARAALQRLQVLMKQDRWAKNAEAQLFRREAETLLGETPAQSSNELPGTQPTATQPAAPRPQEDR